VPVVASCASSVLLSLKDAFIFGAVLVNGCMLK
jgi:hypothetical protein